MQTKILEKCLVELNQPQPNISYLKGMLETLVEMSGGSPVAMGTLPVSNILPLKAEAPDEVDEVLNKYIHAGPVGQLN